MEIKPGGGKGRNFTLSLPTMWVTCLYWNCTTSALYVRFSVSFLLVFNLRTNCVVRTESVGNRYNLCATSIMQSLALFTTTCGEFTHAHKNTREVLTTMCTFTKIHAGWPHLCSPHSPSPDTVGNFLDRMCQKAHVRTEGSNFQGEKCQKDERKDAGWSLVARWLMVA